MCSAPLTRRTRVMLVDDHEIVRDGVREVLERSGEFEVVGQAGDGDAAVRVAQKVKPDLIIMDVLMPVKDGIEACREIKGMMPETKVLILTASSEEGAAMEAVAAGATGFLHKYYGKEQLLRAIRHTLQETRIADDKIKRAFAEIRSDSGPVDTRGKGVLTEREREILTFFAQGMSYAEIADARSKSWLTIRNTVYGIQNKLGVQTKQGLVVWAVRNGLLDDWEISGQERRIESEGP